MKKIITIILAILLIALIILAIVLISQGDDALKKPPLETQADFEAVFGEHYETFNKAAQYIDQTYEYFQVANTKDGLIFYGGTYYEKFDVEQSEISDELKCIFFELGFTSISKITNVTFAGGRSRFEQGLMYTHNGSVPASEPRFPRILLKDNWYYYENRGGT